MRRLQLQSREYRTDEPEQLARQLKERDTEVANQFRAPMEVLPVELAPSAVAVAVGKAIIVPRSGQALKVPTAGPDNAGRMFGVVAKGGSGSITLAGGPNAELDGSDSATISSTSMRWYMSDGRGGWWRV